MKAINIQSYTSTPSTLLPTTVPTPRPSPSTPLLIRITHCSPQHADLLHAQGAHQNNNAKRGWCHPPFVLGYDFAGVVAAIHPAASTGGLQRGDRVFGASIGAFAEYVAVTASAVRKVPVGVSSAAACAMAGQAVSYAAVVHVARVRAGETVLVSGASGGLGSACCAVATAVGARVFALTGDEGKAGVMRRDGGVDGVVVLDGGGKWVGEVKKATEGRGVDVVLDNTGMVDDALRCLAYGGRVVVLGFAARKGVMEGVKMDKLLLKSATVTGYRFGESGRREPGVLEEIWKGYVGMMESGKLKPILYGNYRGLDDVGRALGDLEARKVYGKIVIKVSDPEENAKL
ncbi:NAD(P)-binding protein [Karstenula rhodostoma CBS 690.94]|uniref:NAD(P)-binding protein n=1 Tax=Karstenula rhodostoma CBS 690.94 TaxID=1392251 RepID=A0A9P4PRZ5_9PLEO|nr:NAD(P)-binding protein [Karstenula rhodostoma CBS 690.94]